MKSPRIVDTILFNDELDMLECRLTEIGGIVDHVVIVESPVTFQGDDKPLHFANNVGRFDRWTSKITHIVADELPAGDDPWQREYAQREYVMVGLDRLGGVIHRTDVVLHGDVDEIPRPLQVRNIRPTGFVVFGMRFHPFCVDWIHPQMWRGTVAARLGDLIDLSSVTAMRDKRFTAPCPLHMADAGWHFSWVGSDGYADRKLHSFSHTEIIDACDGKLDALRVDGVHVDGVKLSPVEVDGSWPKWVTDGNAPRDWYRP